MSKPILVIKFGTASITRVSGEPDEQVIARIAAQVAQLAHNHHIVLVSSGAVGAGKKFIAQYSGEIAQRKAAAAVGNPLLLGIYARHFAPYGISVAQSLCERQHFAQREQFLQLKETYQTLWDNGIIPIANENDVVSNRELKFSDNDELATLIAVGFGASTLLICTSAGGLLDKNKEIVRDIPQIDATIWEMVDTSKSNLGTGGMASKLTFTKLATRMGIRTIIFGMNEPEGLLAAFTGKSGSHFHPKVASLTARNRWLASGSLTTGKIHIDAGAANALAQRNSLLSVGIVQITGEFEAGEVVEIISPEGETLAIARTKIGFPSKHPSGGKNIVAHADDIVLL